MLVSLPPVPFLSLRLFSCCDPSFLMHENSHFFLPRSELACSPHHSLFVLGVWYDCSTLFSSTQISFARPTPGCRSAPPPPVGIFAPGVLAQSYNLLGLNLPQVFSDPLSVSLETGRDYSEIPPPEEFLSPATNRLLSHSGNISRLFLL